MNAYFNSYYNYFWKWEHDGIIISLSTGMTIAFTELIKETINGIADQGLPSFGAILLSQIALNNNQQLFFLESITANVDSFYHEATRKNALAFLKLLSSVPNEYHSGEKKIILLRTLFKDWKGGISSSDAQEVVNLLENPTFTPPQIGGEVEWPAIKNDFLSFARKFTKWKTVEDILKAIGDVPEIEEEVNLIPLVGEGEPKDFITELTENEHTFKIGALVKRIGAGIHVISNNSTPSQMPIGGVSDLSNKGNFDQLLVSEFANEDLMFLSRLANNEALYLNRESPPSGNEKSRLILIDVSLKNWGTPKTIAFATMIAIAKHPKMDIPCEVYIIGKEALPVTFDTVHGIIEAIQVVDASLDNSTQLIDFLKQRPGAKEEEVFFLTERSIPQQVEMAKALNELDGYIDYLIVNDVSGGLDVFKKSNKRTKHLQHLEIPYNELWEKHLKKKETNRRSKTVDFPILFIRPAGKAKLFMPKDREVYLINKRKQLFRFNNKNGQTHSYHQGWEFIVGGVQIDFDHMSIGVFPTGERKMIYYSYQAKRLFLWDLDTQDRTEIAFNHYELKKPKNLIFIENAFYYRNKEIVWRFDKKGDFELVNIDFQKYLQSQKEELKKRGNLYSSFYSLLLNIQSISINSNGNLSLNKHELILRQSGHLIYKKNSNQETNLDVVKIKGGIFNFPDGSYIQLHLAGMLEFRSSDQEIPIFFIPPVLDVPIAIATEYTFAGNELFRKEFPVIADFKEGSEQKVVQMKMIHKETLHAFINQILKYGT